MCLANAPCVIYKSPILRCLPTFPSSRPSSPGPLPTFPLNLTPFAQFERFLRSSLRTLSLCITGAGEASSAARRRLVLLDELGASTSSDGDSAIHKQQAAGLTALTLFEWRTLLLLH